MVALLRARLIPGVVTPGSASSAPSGGSTDNGKSCVPVARRQRARCARQSVRGAPSQSRETGCSGQEAITNAQICDGGWGAVRCVNGTLVLSESEPTDQPHRGTSGTRGRSTGAVWLRRGWRASAFVRMPLTSVAVGLPFPPRRSYVPSPPSGRTPSTLRAFPSPSPAPAGALGIHPPGHRRARRRFGGAVLPRRVRAEPAV